VLAHDESISGYVVQVALDGPSLNGEDDSHNGHCKDLGSLGCRQVNSRTYTQVLQTQIVKELGL